MMNIFKRKSNPKKEAVDSLKSTFEWIPLTSISQIEELKKASHSKTIFIFKHSTRCGISRMVLKKFEALITEAYSTIDFYYLDLLNYRTLSDALAETFQIAHQSPQLLVVKNETAIYNDSHYDIIEIDIEKMK